MIKEIFLPEKIGTHRIYSQRILGFSIQADIISCAQIYTKRSKNIIEKLFEQKIEDGPQDTYNERAASSIKKILSKVGKCDQIRVSISSSIVVFKELEIPFIDEEKIRMILDYEVEPMLPFSIEEAVTDFIITKQLKAEKKSQVLVAAVRNEDLERTLDIYTTAGIEPTSITVDLFAVYSLYQQIPDYKNLKKACAIINLGANATRVAFLQEGELRLTRIIPRGILTVAKSVSDDTKIPIEKVEEKIISYGLQTITNMQDYEKSLQKHIINFFNDIQFTLNSFSLKITTYQGISKILFTGPFCTLKGLPHFCNNLLQISCETFSVEKLFSNHLFKNKVKDFVANWTKYATALGTALVSNQQKSFDLRRKTFALPFQKLIKKQVSAASIVIGLIFVTFIVHGYLQISSLSNEIKKIETRETGKLRRIMPKDIRLPAQINLRALAQKAETILTEKLEMWKAFEKTGLRPLEILQELTNIIDKRRFDVNVDDVAISEQDGIPKIEVEGFFKSKTGSDHFRYFAELEKRFDESRFLQRWDEKEEIDSRLVEDKGIKFTAKLKPREY